MQIIQEKRPLMEKRSDQELLALLERDPQAGMEALIGQYTGLLWSVAGKYLSEPENIRDCVDETFIAFYLGKDQYQAEKGSLSLYLAGIARNKAVSQYRKQKKLQPLTEEMAAYAKDPENSMETAELRTDLEALLKNLRPEDADILRMKYYQGMSFREIADSLGLSYETVKKRHTRSLSRLKKLWLITLILLLLALLAACARSLLQHFGIIAGRGMNLNEKLPVYCLAEESSVEGPLGFYRLEDMIYLNGRWSIELSLTFTDQETMESCLGRRKEVLEGRDAEKLTISPITEGPHYSPENNLFFLCSADGAARLEITDSGNCYYDADPLTVHFALNSDPEESGSLDGTDESVRLLRDGGEEWNAEWMGALFPIRLMCLEPSQGQEYPYINSEKAIILASSRLEDQDLIVELYPFSTGEDKVCPALTRDRYMQGQTGDITAVSPDGQTLTGNLSYFSYTAHYSKWNFGPAQPGTYTLHIPYLYLFHTLEEPLTIPFDPETGKWEEARCQPPGFSAAITGISPAEPLELSEDQRLQETLHDRFERTLRKLSSDYDNWRIRVDFRAEAEDLKIQETYFRFECPLTPEAMQDSDPSSDTLQLLDQPSFFYRLENGDYLLSIRKEEGYDLTRCQLLLEDNFSYQWMQGFDLSLEVLPPAAD